MSTMSAEQIEQAVTKHTNSDGKLDLPKDMTDNDKFVIRHAKRTRDAQAKLSKTQLQLQEALAATEILSKKALQLAPTDFGLSPEEVTALETLKFRDPDSYRLKMNELENAASENKAKALEEEVTTAKESASNSFKQQSNISQLEAFRKANPEVDLSDDVLANDVPPRFIQGYNAGSYDYSTYIAKVAEYLSLGTKLAKPNGATDIPNIGEFAGGTKPPKDKIEAHGNKSYAKTTF